ncbi:hypothetical protein T02_10284 [Trichinella nativa]|uniref:Uncharacterized protein n=1 Tax=Trichinella nativa TaxID=6335 RepID=A0A0V1LTC2_9BILA|nr:hypothetical protein T02_10284 [Trichinella nativa]
MTNARCSQNQNLSLTVIKWKFKLLASYSCEANKRQDYVATHIILSVAFQIKSRENFCLLNVRNSSHSRTCLPENVCKFLFHCYAYVYVALMSMIAGLRYLHLYGREYKVYMKAFVLHSSEYALNLRMQE